MMMEQRAAIYPCFAGVSDRELEVAEILIQIPDIMISQLAAAETQAAVLRRCLSWGCKRKRMNRGGGEEQRKRMKNGGGEASCGFLAKAEREALPATTPAAVKVESLSPDTPLELERSQLSQKFAAGKREREKWWEEIHRLTEKKESIEIEVNKVKRHRDNLMAHNLQLKQKKEELRRLNQKKEETPGLEIHPTRLEINPSLNQQMVVPSCQQPAQPIVISPQYQQPIPAPPSVMFYQHPRPHIMHQTAHIQTRQINGTLGMRIVTMFNCNSISGRRDRLDIKMEDFYRGWILYGPNGCNISVEEANSLLKKKLVWTPTTEELELMSKLAPTKRAERFAILKCKKSRHHSR